MASKKSTYHFQCNHLSWWARMLGCLTRSVHPEISPADCSPAPMRWTNACVRRQTADGPSYQRPLSIAANSKSRQSTNRRRFIWHQSSYPNGHYYSNRIFSSYHFDFFPFAQMIAQLQIGGDHHGLANRQHGLIQILLHDISWHFTKGSHISRSAIDRYIAGGIARSKLYLKFNNSIF